MNQAATKSLQIYSSNNVGIPFGLPEVHCLTGMLGTAIADLGGVISEG